MSYLNLHPGSISEDVSRWQSHLKLRGFDPGKIDGVFGSHTLDATKLYQAQLGVEQTGQANQETQEAAFYRSCWIGTLPFIQAKHYQQSFRGTADMVIFHTMECAETQHSAENCANYFASPACPEVSAHFCVDATQICQSVNTHSIAWHAGRVNQVSIGIEHAGYARMNESEWNNTYNLSMLKLSGRLTAILCAQYDIPVVFGDAASLRTGNFRGISTHAEVSKAFGGTHWDPGPSWNPNQYLDYVKNAALGR